MPIKGFTNPLSPNGRAQLVEPLPHHISADAIRVLFRAGEATARAYLPEGLEPVEGGLGYAYVADMVKVSADEPDQTFLNPERTQYGEGIIGFYCRRGETFGRFSAFIWVTEDWSMFFGQLMGWAKKMGEVRRTHLNPFNPGMTGYGPGARLSGQVHRRGHMLFRIGVEVERSVEPSEMPAYGDRGFMVRYLPSIGPQLPEIHQLLSLKLKAVKTGDVFTGRPTMQIGTSDNEDLDGLHSVELVSGWAFKQGWTTDASVELVHDYSLATARTK